VLDKHFELHRQHKFNGELAHFCDYYDSGEMLNMFGWGSISSNYFSFYPDDPPNVDTLYTLGPVANIELNAWCPTAVEPASWGSIKALYR
jgi:hypothetical protein